MNQNLIALSSAYTIFLTNCANDEEALDIMKMLHNKILEMKKKRKDAEITEEFNAVQAAINGGKG